MSTNHRRWVRLPDRFKPQIGLQTLGLAVLICVLDALLHLRFFLLEVKQAVETVDSISGEGWLHIFVFFSLSAAAVLIYRAGTRWNAFNAGQTSRRLLQQEGPNCQTWEDLQNLFFQVLRTRFPLTRLDLLTADDSRERGALDDAARSGAADSVPSGSGVRLPLIQGERTIAIIVLFAAGSGKLNEAQQTELQNLLPELSLTVENFQLRQRTEEAASVRQHERQRISRYLHDSLSHNLAYLRLMLDYQVHSRQQSQGPVYFPETERMLNVANESYEEVRNLLVNLREDAPAELANALKAEAASLAERVNLDIHWVETGKAKPVSIHATRQILLIYREALHNIEKHARASRVQVSLIWTHENMSLLVEDDGVGFQPDIINSGVGHHGLRIMKECAADINAHLMISPAPPSGTCIKLCLPDEAAAKAAAEAVARNRKSISQVKSSGVHNR